MASVFRRALAFALMASALVFTVGPGTASACSCASADPVAAAANAEVVFTGSLIDHVGGDTDPIWTFEVDGWVKGDVPGRTVVVRGQDYGSGCGVPFEWVPSPVAVFADRQGDEIVSIGCSPTPGRGVFKQLLEEAAAVEPMGDGPPAALVIGRSGAANLRVLDGAGELLAQANLDIEPTLGAHCAGTSRIAVWSYAPVDSDPTSDEPQVALTSNVISIIDLATMQPVDQRSIESEFAGTRDRLVCLDGGDRVVLGRGFGPNNGSVTVATSNSDPALDESEDFTGVSRALLHPSGTITLIPSTVIGTVRTLSADDLEPLADVNVDPSLAASHGAFSPDGTRLAILVTTTGNDVQYDSGSTAVLVVDMVDGVVTNSPGERTDLDPGGPGRAKWIEWLDADTWAIERETDSSKTFDVFTTDGTLVSSTDAGWGWGMVRLDGQILRARDGGVELLDRTGTSTPLTPAPTFPDAFSDLAVASFADPPVIDFAPQASSGALLLRDVTVSADPTDATVPSASSQPAEPDDSQADEMTNSFPWPVAIIGGLVIIAGLVALRSEFSNWRQRRSDRNDR